MPLLFGQSLSLPSQEVASHAYPMTSGFLSLLLMYSKHFHCSYLGSLLFLFKALLKITLST